MDAGRFDTVTRSLTVAGSRRRALGILAAALGLRSLADPGDAIAARSGRCRRKPGECERCDRGKCEKKDGKKRCKAGKIKSKPFGTPCSLGTCQNGACIAAAVPAPQPPQPVTAVTPVTPVTCAEGLTICDGTCRDLQDDEANCGACGLACEPRRTCCSGVCRNLSGNRRNCGSCGNICPDPEVCCNGECQIGPC